MKVLITSGTGKVGSEVMKRVLKQGHEAIVMTHSEEKLKKLPAGALGIVSDFERPETWKNLFQDIQKICLITPALENEGRSGCDFLRAAISKGVKHIVLLSIHNAERGAHIPHFRAKLEMEEVLKESKIPYTFIRANNFFQNDQWFLATINEKNVYTQPIGSIGLNRVDTRDIADAIVNALFEDGHHFRSYPLVGPEIMTGERTAKVISRVLGKDIAYPTDALNIWETNFSKIIPDWLLRDLKTMYQFFIHHGLIASEDDFILQTEILLNQPRKYEDYLRELLGKEGRTVENESYRPKYAGGREGPEISP